MPLGRISAALLTASLWTMTVAPAQADLDPAQFEREKAFAGKLIGHARRFATCGVDANAVAGAYLKGLTQRRQPPSTGQLVELATPFLDMFKEGPEHVLNCAFILGKPTIDSTTTNLRSLQVVLEETSASWQHEDMTENDFGLVAEFYLAVVLGGQRNCAGKPGTHEADFDRLVDSFDFPGLREESKELLHEVIERTAKVPAECGERYARARAETLDLFFQLASDKLATIP